MNRMKTLKEVGKMEDKEKATQETQEGCGSSCGSAGGCDSNGGSCSQAGSCGSQPQSLLADTNSFNDIKKVIAVVSGKGGVGKSMVTSLMAVTMNRLGYKTAILDADITGPSIPKAFGVTEKASANELGIFPLRTKTDIGTMSVNNLLENDTDPVIWRGPVIAGTVKQFWTDVLWGEVDYLFVDMPPGTGDVPLPVFQSLPVDGIIVVTSPQELVSMIVGKAVRMAEMMDIPVLGLVENMSYLTCPDCGREIEVFGKSTVAEVAKEYGIDVLGRLPIDPKLATACDNGEIEDFEGHWLDDAAKKVEKL